jgi:hypothetical protein
MVQTLMKCVFFSLSLLGFGCVASKSLTLYDVKANPNIDIFVSTKDYKVILMRKEDFRIEETDTSMFIVGRGRVLAISEDRGEKPLAGSLTSEEIVYIEKRDSTLIGPLIALAIVGLFVYIKYQFW